MKSSPYSLQIEKRLHSNEESSTGRNKQKKKFKLKTKSYHLKNINFSKATRYKLSTEKSLAFLYTNNEKSREIKEQLLHYFNNKSKSLGINLPQGTKDSNAENYKTLMKEIKDNINREIFHAPGLEESIL